MRQISKKQQRKNSIIARIKRMLPQYCHFCGRQGVDAAHLLPKSIFPEYYTHEWNICGFCRSCHSEYDGDRNFRKAQTDLFKRVIRKVKEEDKGRVRKYFGLI